LIPYAAQPRDGQVEEVLGIYRCMTAQLIAYHYDPTLHPSLLADTKFQVQPMPL
jgi:hypothetical protein